MGQTIAFRGLLGWAFGPRNFMKNCPSGDGALRGLTGLPWISGAFCRKFAGSPVCPRFPGPAPRIGFSTLSSLKKGGARQKQVDGREAPIRAATVRESMACHVISQRSPAQRAPRRGSVWQYGVGQDSRDWRAFVAHPQKGGWLTDDKKRSSVPPPAIPLELNASDGGLGRYHGA